MADRPNCLCVISRERLRGIDFVAALDASLGPDDYLEVVLERRSGESSGKWSGPEDRRKRPHLDILLREDGFAVVRAPSPGEERTRPSRGDRYPLLPVLDDDDVKRLEGIRSFKRRRSRRTIPWLVAALAVVVVAAFVLSQTGHAPVQSLVHRVSQSVLGPSGQTAEKPAATNVPAAADTPSRPPAGANAQIERSTRAPNPPSAGSTEPARASESLRTPAVRAPTPGEHAARLVSPRFAGLPRVELRQPGSAGGTYAVRVIDPAGGPMSNADVLLMARMPDGTVENLRLDFYPDDGTYRGALRSTRSSPMDLRVRVITGDKRVDIPLGP